MNIQAKSRLQVEAGPKKAPSIDRLTDRKFGAKFAIKGGNGFIRGTFEVNGDEVEVLGTYETLMEGFAQWNRKEFKATFGPLLATKSELIEMMICKDGKTVFFYCYPNGDHES